MSMHFLKEEQELIEREAMGLDGLKALFQIKGNVDGEMLEEYFKEHLVNELKSGQIVVLDNAGYHKRKSIQKAVEEVGCKLLFLPAYSLGFNPIEQLWLCKQLICQCHSH